MTGTKYFAPKSMEELFKALAEMTPESKIISGGTDLIIEMNSGIIQPGALLYVRNIPELCQISETDGKAEIGAAATMSAISGTPWIKEKLSALFDAASDVGSPQIRNSGTIGGNIGSASPAGDIMPVLFLYNAEITIASKDTLYTKPVNEVIPGPYKSCLAHNEVIVKITIDIPKAPNYRSAYVKLGYRKSVTVSRIGLAVSGIVENGKISCPKLIAGAISPVPLHVKKAEEYLDGKGIDSESMEAAGRFLSELIMEAASTRPSRYYKAAAARGIAEDVLNKLILNPAVKGMASHE